MSTLSPNAGSQEFTRSMLNRALREAVDFIHAEGWGQSHPTLFGLVPSALLIDALPDPDEAAPLTLVVQDFPDNVAPGTGEVMEYLSRVVWPDGVEGAILAQEIRFRDTSEDGTTGPSVRTARLYSGGLKNGVTATLLQLQPTEAELEELGAFGEDEYILRGGPEIAPELEDILVFSLNQTLID